MRILGIIPARGGSKGVPGKNKRILGTKPLIQYTIEAAAGAKSLTDIVVSTDDQEIANISKGLGVEVPGLRPPHLSSDSSPSIDTVIYVLDLLEKMGRRYNAVCLLQPTAPFRTSNDIEDAVKRFQEAKSDSLISVIPIPHEYNPHWVFESTKREGLLSLATGEKNIISRRQDLPPAYIRNGAIYLTNTQIIVNQKSLYGKTISYYVMSRETHINIDTMADWSRAEAMISNLVDTQD